MRVSNRLLSMLPAAELARLTPLLESVKLTPRRVLHQARAMVDYVYFIEEGLVSVQADVGARKWIEVWLIGCEGMVGVPAIAGEHFSTHKRLVQVGGSALRMSVDDLQTAMQRSRILQDLIYGYMADLLFQTSQSGACNAIHPLPRRVARWLLLACAASEPAELPLTHEALARVLGVRRATITECLHALNHDGLIETARGRIRLIDKPGLEEMACPCYRLIRTHHERFLRRFQNGEAAEPAPLLMARAVQPRS